MIEATIQIVDLFIKRMKDAQDRQKSYEELHRKNLEFEVEDNIFLKILTVRRVMRFSKSGYLSPERNRCSSLPISFATGSNFNS